MSKRWLALAGDFNFSFHFPSVTNIFHYFVLFFYFLFIILFLPSFFFSFFFIHTHTFHSSERETINSTFILRADNLYFFKQNSTTPPLWRVESQPPGARVARVSMAGWPCASIERGGSRKKKKKKSAPAEIGRTRVAAVIKARRAEGCTRIGRVIRLKYTAWPKVRPG